MPELTADDRDEATFLSGYLRGFAGTRRFDLDARERDVFLEASGFLARLIGEPGLVPSPDAVDLAADNKALPGVPLLSGTGPIENNGPPAPVPSYTCPRCGRVSHHPDDVLNCHCGACSRFFDRPT